MTDIAPSLHAEVVLRAGQRCEYCQRSQLGQEATFHIDHVVPRAAGGPATADNLALASVSPTSGANTTRTSQWPPPSLSRRDF